MLSPSAGCIPPTWTAPSDRAHLGELYRKLHGSEAGLGDLILKAYDATSSQLAARRAELREFDPNSQLKDPMQFTLSGLDGDKLALSSLLGKVVVIDFWATWCGPCRAQHPLYEQVKAKFKDIGDVVFLAVDADEDHSLVKPFLDSDQVEPEGLFRRWLAELTAGFFHSHYHHPWQEGRRLHSHGRISSGPFCRHADGPRERRSRQAHIRRQSSIPLSSQQQ